MLDVSVVNVALPSMRTGLGMSAGGLQWVVNAYAIAFAGFMLLGGRAGDLYGRKRMFLVGLGLFTAASLGGGLAQEGWQLLVARAAQGLGAAVLAPATLTILTAAVPEGAARTRADRHLGGRRRGRRRGGRTRRRRAHRRPVVALGAAHQRARRRARAARRRALDHRVPGRAAPPARPARRRPRDGGARDASRTASSRRRVGLGRVATLVPLLGGLDLLLVFLVVESPTAAPLMPLRLFRLRAVSAANAVMFVCGSAMFCTWFFMTLYAQNVLGYTPLGAGLALHPQLAQRRRSARSSRPRVMPRTGARNLAVLGMLVTAAGFGWQSTMRAGRSLLALHPGARHR